MKNEIIHHQFRFVYYIVALSVTAIGFSVYQTKGEQINATHLFLGMAVLSWGMSVKSGFNFIKSNIFALGRRHILSGLKKSDGQNNFIISLRKDELKTSKDSADSSFMWLELFFYLGILSFLGWHIVNMIFAGKTL